MDIRISISLRPDKVRELRDIYGIDAESGVYRGFFEDAVAVVAQKLISEGMDKLAVEKAVSEFRPDAHKILEMIRSSHATR